MSLEDRKVGVVLAVCILHALGETATTYRIAKWCKCSRPWVEAPLRALVDDGVLIMELASHRPNTQKRVFEPVEIMVHRAYPEVWEHVTEQYGFPQKLPGLDAIPSRLARLRNFPPFQRKTFDRNSNPALKPVDPAWTQMLDDIFDPERLK